MKGLAWIINQVGPMYHTGPYKRNTRGSGRAAMSQGMQAASTSWKRQGK